MVLENGYLWIVYSMLMAIICLTAVAGAGSALDQKVVKKFLSQGLYLIIFIPDRIGKKCIR